jgi:hypothetical protein
LLKYLYLSTHCFLFFPGTSLLILVQRSFAGSDAGCFFNADSKDFCCSSDHASSEFILIASFSVDREEDEDAVVDADVFFSILIVFFSSFLFSVFFVLYKI